MFNFRIQYPFYQPLDAPRFLQIEHSKGGAHSNRRKREREVKGAAGLDTSRPVCARAFKFLATASASTTVLTIGMEINGGCSPEPIL